MRPQPRKRIGEQTEVIDRLAKRFGKYALVVGVAKRAHDLKERIDSSLEPSGGGMVNRAIGEISRGDVKIRKEESEEESE
jgi:DNA-directed RNA polymerase subunit K/omega